MDKFKQIRAYRTGWIIPILDIILTMPWLHSLAWRKTKGVKLDYLQLKGKTPKESRKLIEKDIKRGAFFMTNHRDIILDASWLSMLLHDRYLIRPFVGVGDNLLSKWFIELAFRFNRGFVVRRQGGPREILQNSQLLSEYIQSLRAKGKSIWLAQREGRAKDSDDRTQPAVIKMLTLSADKNMDFISQVRALNICPVSISYEFDPCDYLKAAEFQLKRDNPDWKKTKHDDRVSMWTGLKGKNGRVIFRLTPSINHWIDAHIDALNEMGRNDQLRAIATQIDKQIFAGYEIFEHGTEFDKYIESRLALIDIPNKDEAFLREKLYEMYNNPVKNHEESNISGLL